MKKIKIALGHKAQVGKDTFLECVQDIIPDVINIKIANGVYNGATAIQKEYRIKPHKDRKLLQFIGNHFRKEMGEDFWIKQTLLQISSLQDKHLINTDCRYQNEFNYLKDIGFTMIKINRPGVALTGEAGDHPSENDLNNESRWDYVLENDGTTEKYYKDIATLINKLINKD